MAKRFTDTNKYKKPFIRSLKAPYKLLWDYLYHDCDHAGIWIVDFDIAQIYIGNDAPVNKEDALMYFNEFETKIVEIDNGRKWFIPSFITFQYGELNPGNRAHGSVIRHLEKYNLIKDNKPHISPLQGGMDMDKDKELDKDKVKNARVKKYDEVSPSIPLWGEFRDYAFEKKPDVSSEALNLKYQAWVENEWKDGNGKKIKNWKTKLLNTLPYLKEKSSTKKENAGTIIKRRIHGSSTT